MTTKLGYLYHRKWLNISSEFWSSTVFIFSIWYSRIWGNAISSDCTCLFNSRITYYLPSETQTVFIACVFLHIQCPCVLLARNCPFLPWLCVFLNMKCFMAVLYHKHSQEHRACLMRVIVLKDYALSMSSAVPSLDCSCVWEIAKDVQLCCLPSGEKSSVSYMWFAEGSSPFLPPKEKCPCSSLPAYFCQRYRSYINSVSFAWGCEHCFQIFSYCFTFFIKDLWEVPWRWNASLYGSHWKDSMQI